MTGELRTCSRCGAEWTRCSKSGHRCQTCRDIRNGKQGKGIKLPLTNREKQVCGLVAEGMLNKEIAWRLHLTEGTIKGFLNRIFVKTETKNRTALAAWTVRQSQLEPPEVKVPI